MSDAPKPRRKPHSTLDAPAATVRMARRLRKEMTLPEVLLWQQLQRHPDGYRFRKQYPLGRYALDFACIRARLAIEVDGEAHNRGDRPARDAIRDAFVLEEGFKTIRISAIDVLKNMEGVIAAIVEACKERARPNPPRNGEVAPRSGDGGAVLNLARTCESGTRPHPTAPTPSLPPPRSGEDFLEPLSYKQPLLLALLPDVSEANLRNHHLVGKSCNRE